MAYESLSSDILERQFGPTELDVMFHGELTRIIATRTVGDGRVLEISRVVFDPEAAAAFPDAYQDMLAGESMGKAFRARGYEFERNIKSAFTCDLPEAFARWFGDNHNATVVELATTADSRPVATILETYRPEVSWPYLPGELSSDQFATVQLMADFLGEQARSD